VTRRAVVFDVGGVVVRWQPLELMRTYLPMVEPQEALAQVFQGWAAGADWLAFDLGQIEPEALATRIATRTGYPRAALASLIAAVPQHLQPMAESLALIERVRAAGHRLGLLSNMPRPYADHLERAHACFAGFEHRAWSGHMGLMKPQRAIFDRLLETMALKAGDVLFIDDHPVNVEAARAYGWQALHFRDAAQCQSELQALGWL
jgi:putative hydrolase of the HAD superfamily